MLLSFKFFYLTILSLLLGGLIGLERSFSKKQFLLGIRSYSFITLLGFLLKYLNYDLYGFLFIIIFTSFLFITSFILNKAKIGFTTILSIILAYLIGVLLGLGKVYVAVFITTLIVCILWLKQKTIEIVKRISKEELEEIFELFLFLGAIYPLLPKEIEIFGIKIIPLEIFYIVLFLVTLNFVAYLLSKKIDLKYELIITSFLGGIIDSTSTLFSIIHNFKTNYYSFLGTFFSTIGMIIRNLVILLFFLKGQIPLKILLIFIYFILALIIPALFLIYYYPIYNKKIHKILIKNPLNIKFAIKISIFIFSFIVLISFIKNLVPSNIFDLYIFISAFLNTTATNIAIFSTENLDIDIVSKQLTIILLGGYFSQLVPLIYNKKWKIAKFYALYGVFITFVGFILFNFLF